MEAPPSMFPPQQQQVQAMRTNNAKSKKQEQIVKEFAALLSTKKPDDGSKSPTDASSSANILGSPSSRSLGKKLISFLSDDVADDEVVLVLPSLDIRLSEEQHGALPKIGETGSSSSLQESIGGREQEPQDDPSSRPSMAASVLTAASNDAAKVEQKAATNVNKSTSWTRSTVMYAAHAVSENASDFFSNLIDSRLRAWTLLLLRHSLSTGDSSSRTKLLSMLSASIQVKNAVTNFKTLPMPNAAEGQPREADVILPLLFEVVLNLSLKENSEAVTLRAPGTISGE